MRLEQRPRARESLSKTTQRAREEARLPVSDAWAFKQGTHALTGAALTLSLIPALALAPVYPPNPAPDPALIPL